MNDVRFENEMFPKLLSLSLIQMLNNQITVQKFWKFYIELLVKEKDQIQQKHMFFHQRDV